MSQLGRVRVLDNVKAEELLIAIECTSDRDHDLAHAHAHVDVYGHVSLPLDMLPQRVSLDRDLGLDLDLDVARSSSVHFDCPYPLAYVLICHDDHCAIVKSIDLHRHSRILVARQVAVFRG